MTHDTRAVAERIALTDEELAQLGAFDPSDPFNAMAESFRRQIALMASTAFEATIFRELTPEQQLEALIAGITTGLLGICFIYAGNEQRDEMTECVASYLPQARANAEEMADEALAKEAAAIRSTQVEEGGQ